MIAGLQAPAAGLILLIMPAAQLQAGQNRSELSPGRAPL
jgi:hypothetical protein